MSHCAYCTGMSKRCISPLGKCLTDCPTKNEKELIGEAMHFYDDEPMHSFNLNSQIQTGHSYAPDESGAPQPVRTRLEETVEFCRLMGYERIGLAFCITMGDYALKLSRALETAGLEVVSVMCKVGGVTKDSVGVAECDKIVPGRREIMCNPAVQAAVLNRADTQLNIVLGLCVGHDSMFFRASIAPCTVFAVKDRVLGNNSLLALQQPE